MANTGYKQAVIAYKVARDTGEPLDVYGIPISVSGRRQAIALLEGWPNPDPGLYEVQGTFAAHELAYGEPTITQNLTDCPVPGTDDWLLLGGHWNYAGFWRPAGVWTY